MIVKSLSIYKGHEVTDNRVVSQMMNFLLSIVVSIFSLLFSGCLLESSGPSHSDFTSNRIPVSFPDIIDVDVYRIEITSDSTEPFVYYQKPGSDGLYISVPSNQEAQIAIGGYKKELLVYSATATINPGQTGCHSFEFQRP